MEQPLTSGETDVVRIREAAGRIMPVPMTGCVGFVRTGLVGDRVCRFLRHSKSGSRHGRGGRKEVKGPTHICIDKAEEVC